MGRQKLIQVTCRFICNLLVGWLHHFIERMWQRSHPSDTRRNNVIMTSKRRGFDVIMTLLRCVPIGQGPDSFSTTGHWDTLIVTSEVFWQCCGNSCCNEETLTSDINLSPHFVFQARRTSVHVHQVWSGVWCLHPTWPLHTAQSWIRLHTISLILCRVLLTRWGEGVH